MESRRRFGFFRLMAGVVLLTPPLATPISYFFTFVSFSSKLWDESRYDITCELIVFSLISFWSKLVLGMMYLKASSHICFSTAFAAIKMNFLFVVVNTNCDEFSCFPVMFKLNRRNEFCEVLRPFSSGLLQVSSTSRMSLNSIVRTYFSSVMSFLISIYAFLKHTMKYFLGKVATLNILALSTCFYK